MKLLLTSNEPNFEGVIIEESLADKKVLDRVKILSTNVEQITERHKTPWIKQWTLHTVEIPSKSAQEVAEEISKALDPEHNWYADFRTDKYHYIIFKNKVFFIDRSSREQYDEATRYGISIGIPEYQVDFDDYRPKWER